MGRTVTALVTKGDDVLGTVGPFAVATPWWADVAPVVERLAGDLGVPVLVLRLLRVEDGDGARDGHVTYHAEALEPPVRPPPAPRGDRPAGDDELRAPWARVDGLRELLAWADGELAAAGRPRTGPVDQRRTWNLAGLFRLPTGAGPVWLKATPRFAADEAAVIAAFARVDPALVPAVLASGERRILLEELPGEDCRHASPEAVAATIERFVAAQAAVRDPGGLPDRRTPRIMAMVRGLLDGPVGDELTPAERTAAHTLVRRWPELDACGLPDTVVHGDFHPGNWRGGGDGAAAVLDFADAYVGNPVLDGLRACDFLPEATRPAAVRAWVRAWRAHRPGSDPARALEIGAPLADLAYAVRYQEFLDGIEPSERVYHLGDPITVIRRALRTEK